MKYDFKGAANQSISCHCLIARAGERVFTDHDQSTVAQWSHILTMAVRAKKLIGNGSVDYADGPGEKFLTRQKWWPDGSGLEFRAQETSNTTSPPSVASMNEIHGRVYDRKYTRCNWPALLTEKQLLPCNKKLQYCRLSCYLPVNIGFPFLSSLSASKQIYEKKWF